MAVPVTMEESTFQAGNPEKLFELESGGPPFLRPYDVAPDGTQFVWLKQEAPQEEQDRAHLRFIFNWFDELESRVPTGRR